MQKFISVEGLAYEKLGNYEQAINDYEKAIKLNQKRLLPIVIVGGFTSLWEQIYMLQ